MSGLVFKVVVKKLPKVHRYLVVSLEVRLKRTRHHLVTMMNMLQFLLTGHSKVFKHGKAKTLYLSIPSKMAEDSAFTIKEGDEVEIEFDKKLGAVVIRPKAGKSKPSE